MRHSPDMAATADAGSAVLPVRGHGLMISRGGRALLDRLDITIAAGPLLVIMGPNGAGKSLLLRALARLVPVDSGLVTWAGTVPGRDRAPRLGFVFQKPVMLRRTALDNIAYALKVAGVPRDERAIRALSGLRDAGLAHLAGSPARVLSGGEQQRLAIARALATRPDVLLLDEPTASLDPVATLAIETLVRAAHAGGTTVAFVTHDLGQARRLAGEVIFMNHGRIAERSAADRFFAAPSSDVATAFLEGRLLP